MKLVDLKISFRNLFVGKQISISKFGPNAEFLINCELVIGHGKSINCREMFISLHTCESSRWLVLRRERKMRLLFAFAELIWPAHEREWRAFLGVVTLVRIFHIQFYPAVCIFPTRKYVGAYERWSASIHISRGSSMNNKNDEISS